MTPENFVYWLQGWFELNKTIDHREGATPETLKVIENHLALVLNKVTPTVGKLFPEAPAIGPSLPVQPYLPAKPVPFGVPGWLTQEDGKPWPPGTIIC